VPYLAHLNAVTWATAKHKSEKKAKLTSNSFDHTVIGAAVVKGGKQSVHHVPPQSAHWLAVALQ